MRGFKPIEITSDMVVASNLFETAPALYDAGTTYAADVYVSVVGLTGKIDIYKSLTGSNTGNTPDSSPSWWIYSSSTYEEYSASSTYTIGDRVLDAANHKIYECIVYSAKNRPFLPTVNPSWVALGKSVLLTPANYAFATSYSINQLVYSSVYGLVDDVPVVVSDGVYKSLVSGNLGNSLSDGTKWEFIPNHPVPYISTNTYAAGRVVIDEDKETYISMVNDNFNCPLSNTPAWFEYALSNTDAFLDTEVSTQSVAYKEIEFTVEAGVFDSLALVGVEGGEATITVRDGLGGTIVYESTQGISGEIVADWYAFLYGDATIPLHKVVFENVPPYVDAHVTVKISSDGYVKLGAVLLGVMHELGIAGYGASVSLVDYSIKKTDDFGKTTFVRRGFKEKIELTVQLEKLEFNRVHNHLLNLRSTPWFLVVADDPDLSEALYMFGYYNSYRNVIEAPTFTLYSLEFESLVN